MPPDTELSETIEIVRGRIIESLPKATLAQMVGCFNLIKPEHVRTVAKFNNHDVGAKRLVALFDEATEIELADMLPVAAGQLGIELEPEAKENFKDAIEVAKQTRITQEEMERRANPTVASSAGSNGEETRMQAAGDLPVGVRELSANAPIKQPAAAKKAAAKKAAAPAPAKVESETAKRARLVKEFLTKNGATSVKDLASGLRLTELNVRNGIDALRRDKTEVFAHGGGVFALTKKDASAPKTTPTPPVAETAPLGASGLPVPPIPLGAIEGVVIETPKGDVLVDVSQPNPDAVEDASGDEENIEGTEDEKEGETEE